VPDITRPALTGPQQQQQPHAPQLSVLGLAFRGKRFTEDFGDLTVTYALFALTQVLQPALGEGERSRA